MDVQKVVDAFKTDCPVVIEKMIHCEVEPRNVFLKGHCSPSFEYAVMIGVSGSFTGAITMSLKKETASYLMTRMMGPSAPETFNDIGESAMMELANMTVAHALIKASDDKPFDITPPSFVKGENITYTVEDVQQSFVITFNTNGGVIEFNISLED